MIASLVLFPVGGAGPLECVEIRRLTPVVPPSCGAETGVSHK